MSWPSRNPETWNAGYIKAGLKGKTFDFKVVLTVMYLSDYTVSYVRFFSTVEAQATPSQHFACLAALGPGSWARGAPSGFGLWNSLTSWRTPVPIGCDPRRRTAPPAAGRAPHVGEVAQAELLGGRRPRTGHPSTAPWRHARDRRCRERAAFRFRSVARETRVHRETWLPSESERSPRSTPPRTRRPGADEPGAAELVARAPWVRGRCCKVGPGAPTGGGGARGPRAARSSVSLPAVFEQYQKARTQFVQMVAELATRPQNIETLQNAGEPSPRTRVAPRPDPASLAAPASPRISIPSLPGSLALPRPSPRIPDPSSPSVPWLRLAPGPRRPAPQPAELLGSGRMGTGGQRP